MKSMTPIIFLAVLTLLSYGYTFIEHRLTTTSSKIAVLSTILIISIVLTFCFNIIM